MGASSRSAGFTLIELLVVMGIVAVVATTAVVGFQHARQRSAEAAAVGALSAINQAQFVYMQSCGKGRYAPSLASLGMPAPGSEHGFVSGDLAVSDPLVKSGYLIQLSGTDATEGEQTCTGLVPLETYRLTADPTMAAATGGRFYGTNTDRVIYRDQESFADDMPERGGPGHGEEIR